ncbi:hypothetical protein V5P93_005087 [Actinokineospora auranticolor]|uniref:DoxX-like protein n=1 Tax=Actinokineospora auranticolor TaxID=155976 RepID=A0A2S6GK70_9PSEU|nr:hypothetical protein [Actinokineospora auranticolor]PPK65617.1 hypothetical protein CLV40_113101 [Actinokineospora auranticolor]
MTSFILRVAAAVALLGAGLVHADLYLHGYRALAVIGPAFLLQAAASLALAVLLPCTDLLLLRLAAAGAAGGALVGFVLSRTVGLFGFTESGLQPAPEALLSVIAEFAVLALLTADVLYRKRLNR